MNRVTWIGTCIILSLICGISIGEILALSPHHHWYLVNIDAWLLAVVCSAGGVPIAGRLLKMEDR